MSEEEISSCDAYKNLKLRLEDLATRYNHIEAVNKELGEKTEALEGERTAFKDKITEEQERAISDMQTQLTKTEQDLARIRATRDDLLLDQQIRKAREAEKLSSVKEVNELAEARQTRINSMELEIERLRPSVEANPAEQPDITNLDLEELRKKYLQLDKSYKMLSQELPGLEQAFKKAHDLGSKKVAYLQETEDRIKRLHAEVRSDGQSQVGHALTSVQKAKADSRYFTAMKAKEAMVGENRALKNQNSKSTEIITQLKETEKRVRDSLVNLEKQLAEMKSSNQNMLLKHKELQSNMGEQSNTIVSLKSQIGELSNSLRNRDAALSKEASLRREAGLEAERLQVRADEAERALETNKPKESENSQLEALRVSFYDTFCLGHRADKPIANCPLRRLSQPLQEHRYPHMRSRFLQTMR